MVGRLKGGWFDASRAFSVGLMQGNVNYKRVWEAARSGDWAAATQELSYVLDGEIPAAWSEKTLRVKLREIPDDILGTWVEVLVKPL